MNTLKELFLDELADMYDAEHRLTKALPKMIKAATCPDLQTALQHHLQETESQAERLERVFATFQEKPRWKKCPAIVGLIDEAEALASEHKKSPALNAAVISAGQKIEHYEIASYGCLRAWAQLLGNQEAMDLIEGILDEEKGADRTLNVLSEEKNEEALQEVGVGAASGGRHQDEE